MVGRVAKHQAADEDPLLPLAHGRVPHGGGVVAALDAMPRARDLPVLRRDAGLEELDAAVRKVGYARSFYNNAVTATRAARRKLLPRILPLSGRAPLPEFFEIDDGLPEP